MGTARRLAALPICLAILAAATAAAQDRLGVLELFGRPTCPNCQEASRILKVLQQQYRGRAVLLEYDYDTFRDSPRVDRFWKVSPRQVYLPLVMVGSGFKSTSGPNPEAIYRTMINAELARPPAAAVSAFSRRSGNTLRLYVRVENTGDDELAFSVQPTLWVIVWEKRPFADRSVLVSTALPTALPAPLVPSAAVGMVVDTPAMAGVDWSQVESLALVERWLADEQRYDALQASVSQPAALTATPPRIALDAEHSRAPLSLTGPHVLAWTATPDVEWLRVEPATGVLPATPTVTLVPGLQPRGPAEGTIRVEAAGDGMDFTAVAEVVLGSVSPRPAAHRLAPSGAATGD